MNSDEHKNGAATTVVDVSRFSIYWCEVCEVNCTSEAGYELHLAGTKHQRKMTKLTDRTDQILDRPNKSFPVRPNSCSLCEVHCSSEASFKQHLESFTHKKNASKTFLYY